MSIIKSTSDEIFCNSQKEFVNDNDKYKQFEGRYYYCLSWEKQNEIYCSDLDGIKAFLAKGKDIYEMYKKGQLNTIQFDFDFKDSNSLNHFKDLITCFNDIITDKNLRQLYKNIKHTPRIDILAYGKYTEEEVNELCESKHKHLNIHYEQKTELKKSLSAHVAFNCVVLHDIINLAFSDKNNVRLTNKNKDTFIDMDLSIYKESGVWRIASSNKDSGKIKTGLNITDEKEFFRQFRQYPYKLTEKEKAGYETIFNYLMDNYIIYDVKKQQAKQLPKEETDKELKTKDKEEIEECNNLTPVPLGLIAEILTHYPVGNYDETICQTNDIYWSGLSGFIKNCPYDYDEIEDIIYNHYNQIEHNHPDALNDYVKNNMEYNNSAQYFFSLLKPFNDYITFDDYIINKAKNDEFNYNDYIRYKNKGPSKLKLEELEEYNELKKQYNNFKVEYNETYNNNDNKLLYRHYLRIFNIIQIFTQEFNPTKLSRYDYYKDSITRKIYVKSQTFKNSKQITFIPTSQQEFKGSYDEDVKKIIITNKQEFNNIMYKYTYVREEDKRDAERMLYIRGLGIKEEIDRKKFFDFVRFKLLNEESIYKHNFILWGDKNSLKTSFIDTLSDFIDVSKLEPSKINAQFNTEFKASVILIDELPANMKERTKVIETLKRNTETRKIEIERKGYDKEIINNKSNIIINTNHKEIGGLFDYQENGEMFKRFYIVETKEIPQDLIKEYVEYLQHPEKIKAFIELMKELPPLTNDELNNLGTQQQYYNYVKQSNNNRNILSSYDIFKCVSKRKNKYYLRMLDLIKTLKQNNIMTSKEKERQLLENEKLIIYNSEERKYIIESDNVYKFFKYYYSIDDDDEELKNDLIEKYSLEFVDSPL